MRGSLLREAAAAREFAEESPVPSPEPVALGEPGHGYPLPCSVQTWLPGRDAVNTDPACSRAFAEVVASLLTCLRAVDTRGRRFSGLGRGRPPPNVLVAAGRLVGVLDTGGFSADHPALDLVSVWHLCDVGQRPVVRDLLGCSDVQWRRGMAWALQQAMGLVWYYAQTNPVMSHWGKRSLRRLLTSDGM